MIVADTIINGYKRRQQVLWVTNANAYFVDTTAPPFC